MKELLSKLLCIIITIVYLTASLPVMAKTSYPDSYVTYDFETGCVFDDISNYGKYYELGGTGITGKVSFAIASDEGIVDHTTGLGSGKVLKIGPRSAATSRLKFVDLLNLNGVTAKDVGSVYEVSMWLYNPQDTQVDISLQMFSNRLYNSADGEMFDASGTGNVNNTSNVTSAYSNLGKAYSVPSGEWTQVKYEVTLPSVLISSVTLVLGTSIPTIYIDDVSVRIKTDNRVVNEESDLTPFSQTERFDITAQNDGDVYNFENSNYIKYAANKEYFNTRYIPETDAVYKINLRASSAGEALKIVATSVNVDKTVGRDDSNNFLTEWNMNVVDDYVLSSGMNDSDKASVLSYTVSGNDLPSGKTITATTSDKTNPVYKEFSILFKDFGSTALTVYEGKKQDVLRGFDIIATDDAGYSVQNYEVKKINLAEPVQNGDFEKTDFSDWGYNNVPSLFAIENGKLKITNDAEEKSISQTVVVKGATDYKLNYKLTNPDAAKVKIEIFDKLGNLLKSKVISTVGVETDKFIAFTSPLSDEIINIKITSLVDENANSAYIDDLQLTQTSIDDIENYAENEKVTVYGSLKNYTVSSPVNVYLIKDGYSASDYLNTDAVFANTTVTPCGNIYEAEFDMSSVTSYQSNFDVVVTGIAQHEYITEKLVYESAMFKENLIRNISQATSKDAIKGYITGGVTPLNTVVLGLDAIDLYNDISSVSTNIDFVSDYIFKNKESVFNAQNPSDETLICNVAKEGSILCILNKNAVSLDTLQMRISSYESLFGFDSNSAYTDIYKTLETYDKQQILSDMIIDAVETNIYTISDLNSLLSKHAIKKAISDSNTYSEVIAVISSNKAFLGINDDIWNTYDSLTSEYKPTAEKKIAAYAKAAADLQTISANIIPLVNEAVAEINSVVDDRPSSGGGGGGRSSISVSTTSAVVPNTTESGASENKTNAEFADLNEAEWAKNYIESFAEKGYISGYEDGTFKPNNSITRKEIAKILALCFDVYDKTAESNFNDLNSDDWSYAYVASLEKLGIVKGDGNGNFNPDANITRQDITVMVYRMLDVLNLKEEQVEEELSFSDADRISQYAQDAVKYLKAKGIISGMTDNTFAPLENTTRAQAVKILDTLVK